MREEVGQEHIGNAIDTAERRYLVGREKEVAFFQKCLTTSFRDGSIIHLYGTGGIGKSFLLDEFRRFSAGLSIKFVLLDSRDFMRKPPEFCAHVLRILHYPMKKLANISENQIVELCLIELRKHAKANKLVLAFDTFEEMGEMEYWLREEFLPQLSKNTLIVISGRYPLQGGWSFSPAWRELIWRLPIEDLDYSSVKAYLARAGIVHEDMIHHVWNQTKGHPLTLSLLVSTTLAQQSRHVVASDAGDVFSQVVEAWLREVPDAVLRELVEAAAVLRHFNEELLAYVMEKPVTTEQFLKLVNLSFIRRVDRG